MQVFQWSFAYRCWQTNFTLRLCETCCELEDTLTAFVLRSNSVSADVTSPHVVDILSRGHFRKRIKKAVEHIVSQFPFVIEKVLAAESPELWDWSALGLPLLSHDKGGEGLSRGTASAPSLLTAEHAAGERTEWAQYSTEPLRERG